MTHKQAISLNTNSASNAELRQAIIELKREYSVSSRAIENRGKYSHLQETFKENLHQHPQLYGKKIGQLNQAELRQVYSQYRGYFSTPNYNEKGQFTGYKDNMTSTLKGLLEYENKVGTKVLGLESGTYEKMSVKEQKELWDTIDKARELAPEYFLSKGLGSSALYGSDENIKRAVAFIKDKGITDPQDLVDELKGFVNSELIEMPYNEDEDLPFDF